LSQELNSLGFRLWLDAGVHTAADANELGKMGIDRIVAGLETLRGPDELLAMVDQWGERIAFSLDLKEGRPLCEVAAWGTFDPENIAMRAIQIGLKHVLVLDVSRVGIGMGTGTEALIARLSSRFPSVEFIAGGGVRGPEDLVRLRQCGAAAVLVSSALHSGKLP